MVSGVVAQIHFANRLGLVPIADATGGTTEYNDAEYDDSDPRAKGNAWRYYFEPVSSMSLEESQRSELVLYAKGAFPPGYPGAISHSSDLRETTLRNIRIREDIMSYFVKERELILGKSRVLGVHFRGQDMKVAASHPLPPTNNQMLEAIEHALLLNSYDRIFVVSQAQECIELLQKTYGPMVYFTKTFRTRGSVNAYKIPPPRPMHKYMLGKEVLIDMLLLSQCNSLVSSQSNVSEVARIFNDYSYEVDLVIDNGLNSSLSTVASILWASRNILPGWLGGFSAKAIRSYTQSGN